MIALLDGDIFVYRIGFTTETETVDIAKWRMDELINTVFTESGATEYKVFLTASNDPTAFRKLLYPEYKGNRKAPRPIHYQAMREYLVERYGASVSPCIEADDAIGIESQNGTPCIIVSIDKDLMQLPGLHYNFVKKEFTQVDKHTGLRFFYLQCLTGDKADNIKGIDGIGPKKAERILNQAEQWSHPDDDLECYESAWFQAVREAYNDDLAFWRDGNCLWILQQPYPHGAWSYHPLGKQLTPEINEELSSSQRTEESSLDVITTTTSMDGQELAGTNL